jgi:transposase
VDRRDAIRQFGIVAGAGAWLTIEPCVAPARETPSVDLIQEYEARIAALERLVGKQALELEFLKGALRQGQRPRREPMSVIIGPTASPSPKDAG